MSYGKYGKKKDTNTALVHIVRDQQVLLDSDLAMLYSVEKKRLNEQIKRNMEHLPLDFMFQHPKEEDDFLRSQFVTSNNRGGQRYLHHTMSQKMI